jgi:ABC-type transport system involved in multi-copper enzyme maturation permease subunit
MSASAVRMMLRDELVGFAKSKVMIVLWVVLPILAALGYFLLPTPGTGGQPPVPMVTMMALLLSSLAGTISAVMIGVDIVGEKSRNVYEVLIIRLSSRTTILWSKFFAVFICVTIACVVSLGLGITVDLIRGVDLPDGLVIDTLKSLGSVIGVIALSSSVGVLFGVISNSTLVVVILILYVGQNLAIVPMLPAYLNLGDGWYWIILAISAALTLGMMFFAGLLFRRKEF